MVMVITIQMETPKITKLDSWKMALATNVTRASADPDIAVWMSWVACAFVVNPDQPIRALSHRLIKGREIIAIILQSFRSSDRSDMTFTIEYLIRLRNKWYDILLNLRKEDTPREITLRDILYHKIKGSRKLECGLNTYARLPDAHPEKTYRFLLGLID